VAEHLQLTSDSLQWNVDFIRAAQDYEVVFYAMIFIMVCGKILCCTKSFYNVCTSYDSDSFPWRSIWRSKVPSRVVFFAWSEALGRSSPWIICFLFLFL
jgi:hypothetical protein